MLLIFQYFFFTLMNLRKKHVATQKHVESKSTSSSQSYAQSQYYVLHSTIPDRCGNIDGLGWIICWVRICLGQDGFF